MEMDELLIVERDVDDQLPLQETLATGSALTSLAWMSNDLRCAIAREPTVLKLQPYHW